MDNLRLSAIIKNNIGLKNLEGNRDIVIYDNKSGENEINNIALEMGATYEIFISSAFDSVELTQHGQQKITIKLIPAENTPNNYDLYMPVHYVDTNDNSIEAMFIIIYKYGTELWTISAAGQYFMQIYKIVKKAV